MQVLLLEKLGHQAAKGEPVVARIGLFYPATVGEAGYPGEPPGPRFERLIVLVRKKPELFQFLSETVAREVPVRTPNIRARIIGTDTGRGKRHKGVRKNSHIQRISC